MSLLSWLSGRKPEKDRERRAPPLQFPPPPVAAPLAPPPAAPAAAPAPSAQAMEKSQRKAERAANRELLYPVVRESMLKAGILSTRYTFKLLTTDTRGEKFLVMVDMAPEFLGDMSRLNEIETLIQRAAAAGHDLRVQAVYWRANATMAAEPAHSVGAPSTQARINSLPDPWAPPASAAAARSQAAPQAAAARAAAPASNYGMLTGFEQTELLEDDEDQRTPALSATQYGHLGGSSR